jgi:hypothetical protein
VSGGGEEEGSGVAFAKTTEDAELDDEEPGKCNDDDQALIHFERENNLHPALARLSAFMLSASSACPIVWQRKMGCFRA